MTIHSSNTECSNVAEKLNTYIMLPRRKETLLRQPLCILHSHIRTGSQIQSMCIYHASNWSMAIITHHRLRKYHEKLNYI